MRFENIPYLSPTADCVPPTTEFLPDDPMFGDQWGLQRIQVPRAWEIARADASVTVAVIDEGVELGHPDLELHPESWNASSDVPDGSPTGNHGTACAGIAAARLDNTQGLAGVAGGARVMAIATATWADVDIAEGLYFAADNGARVVSMSFGVYPSWNFWDFDLVRDALQYAHDQGLVLVAASGNEDWAESRFPGSDGRTLCVGGSNRSDERTARRRLLERAVVGRVIRARRRRGGALPRDPDDRPARRRRLRRRRLLRPLQRHVGRHAARGRTGGSHAEPAAVAVKRGSTRTAACSSTRRACSTPAAWRSGGCCSCA